MNRGRLLAFEGLDGCGKSTQVAALARALRAERVEPLVTREPSDSPAGRHIRALARSGQPLAPEEELRWFVEDRRAHVDGVIEPALATGRWVVTDRYYLSSVAYQGGRGLDPERILRRSEAEFPVPDLVLLLEIEPARALKRLRGRGRELERRFEDPEFLERVAAIFRTLERSYIRRIDAEDAPEVVAQAVLECVRRELLSSAT